MLTNEGLSYSVSHWTPACLTRIGYTALQMKRNNYRNLTLSACARHEGLSLLCLALDTCLSHEGYWSISALQMKRNNYRNFDVVCLCQT
ncbi:hypothetical protein J6590_069019 [Homalodisca vitripennis]|nr:hypothetical protein J6590_069019 [Homalodisca vitripennis]